MPGYKADGTIVPDTPRNPNTKPSKKAGGGPAKTPPTPHDLQQIQQRRIEAAQGRSAIAPIPSTEEGTTA